MKREYMLQVGDGGEYRLNLLNNILNFQSENFLSGFIKKGMRVIEAGCGVGHMTVWLAEKVGENGKVVALDSSQEQIDIAKVNVRNRNLKNVEFICADIESFQHYFTGKFDIAYCRFLMIHLNKPELLIDLFHSLLKPAGIAVFEEPVAAEAYTEPNSDLWHLLLRTYIDMSKKNNKDANYGSKIVPALQNSGFNSYDSISYHKTLSYEETVKYILACFSEFNEAYYENGVCTADEINDLAKRIKSGVYKHIKYSCFHKIFQVAAKK